MRTEFKIWKRLNMFVLAVAATGFSLSVSAQSGEITHSPAFVEAQVGEPFEVTVFINPGGEPVSVIDLHMRFNPLLIEVLALEPLQAGLGNLMIQPTFNNEDGTISIGAFEIGANMPAAAFPMLKITFNGLMPAETQVLHPTNIFPRSIMAYAGENRLNQVGPLDISITGDVLLSVSENVNESASLNIWPNPARGETLVTFETIHSGFTNIDLCDITGHVVATIYSGSLTSGAQHSFDVNLNALADGMYLCRVITGGETLVKRLVVVK